MFVRIYIYYLATSISVVTSLIRQKSKGQPGRHEPPVIATSLLDMPNNKSFASVKRTLSIKKHIYIKPLCFYV